MIDELASNVVVDVPVSHFPLSSFLPSFVDCPHVFSDPGHVY